MAFHTEHGATATLLTTLVEDPRRYGLVDRRDDGQIASFIEKPGDDRRGPGLINAGVYVLEQEVLAMIPPGRQFSIERGVFPELAERGGLYSYVGDGYWRDIGTPQSYLEAHFDILGRSVTSAGYARADGDLSIAAGARVAAGVKLVPPAYVEAGVTVGAGAQIGPWAVVGRGSRIGPAARIVASVLQDAVIVGAGAVVERSVVVRGVTIGSRSELRDVVIGEACTIGDGNVLANGLHLYPQAVLPDHSVRFRADEAMLVVPASAVAVGNAA